jgi:hypothetical protein
MRFRRVAGAEALGYWQSSLAGLPSFARLDGSETRPHTGIADYHKVLSRDRSVSLRGAGLPSFARLDGSETRPHTGSVKRPACLLV